MNVAELYEWVSANFWNSEQIAAWAQNTFYRRKVHKQARDTASANLPIITNGDGYVDVSFVNGTDHTELIADTVGAMLTGNTETNITVTYQDSDNTIDFVVATNTEDVQDIVGGMATDSTSIDFTYNDAAGTLTAARAALTGDVTASANANVTTIANDAVTNAKLANMANATIKGRTTAGAGDPEDLTAAQAAAIIQASIDHGALAGLSDNDHPQYALLSAENSFTAGPQHFFANASEANFRTYSDRTALGAGSVVSSWEMWSNDTSNAAPGVLAAAIAAYATQTHNTTQVGSRLAFLTVPNGSLTLTERGYFGADGILYAYAGINVGEDTLDVYDEGTWTPSITCSGSNPTITYTTRYGTYQRINSVYHFQGSITVASSSGGAGELRISLPATSVATGAQTGSAWVIDSLPLQTAASCWIEPSQSYMRIILGSGTGYLQSGWLAAGVRITFSGILLT